MAKGSGQAEQTFGTSTNNANTMSGRASAVNSAMMPGLTADAAGKGGLTPGQKATMDTASQQSVGGSNAGITGQAGLTAGRSGNPGSMISAIGSADRGNARNLSNDALKTQEYSTNMAQQKQQSAMGELGKLYGTNVSGLGDMLKNANQATSNLTTADQDTTGDIMKGAQMATSMVGM
jgi:hypothetical protein